MWSTLESFYASDKWRTFRLIIINNIIEKHEKVICERCGKEITEEKFIQVHHKNYLTLDNVNDYRISLNPDNVEVLCQQCHNKEHNRFHGTVLQGEKKVYIVYGPPGAGKTTYVINNKSDNDIVIDMDRLYEAITLLPRYTKPNKLLSMVTSVKNHMLDNIKTRYGKWDNAWVIGGYADKYKREQLIQELNAKTIFIQATKEECIEHIKQAKDRNVREYIRYIERWFERYRE